MKDDSTIKNKAYIAPQDELMCAGLGFRVCFVLLVAFALAWPGRQPQRALRRELWRRVPGGAKQAEMNCAGTKRTSWHSLKVFCIVQIEAPYCAGLARGLSIKIWLAVSDRRSRDARGPPCRDLSSRLRGAKT